MFSPCGHIFRPFVGTRNVLLTYMDGAYQPEEHPPCMDYNGKILIGKKGGIVVEQHKGKIEVDC